ncbi:MAG: GspE/PulE family protein [Planctomycetota bacterium]
MLNTSEFILKALVEEQALSRSDADEIRRFMHDRDASIEDAAMYTRKVSTRDLAIAKAGICEYPFLDLTAIDADIRNSRRISKTIAERLGAFPLYVFDDIATVAMEDPLDLQAMDQLRQLLRRQIDPVVCDAEMLRMLITRAYTLDAGGETEAADTTEATGREEEPIVAAVNQILFSAAHAGASDIHINPDEKTLHLRLRIDGVLQAQQGPAITMHEGIVQRLKVMSQLDVTQTRRPQDGKFRFRHKGQPIDVRLSLIPTIHGENAVMRLLRPAASIGSIAELGMPADVAEQFAHAISKPHGMLLVTGPTGSGKTTSLYTALNSINTPDRNIMTVEDPVEIRLPLIRQIQANNAIGLNFASALRSILRQDPDVVLIGEIRDEETARIASQAALTGHLVFSTLHTNDAAGSIARLREFGVPPFAISNSLLGTIAQRLVRRVCTSCATTEKHDPGVLRSLGVPELSREFSRGSGCPSCMSTGYKGRIGVYEMLTATAGVRALIEQDANVSEILEFARSEGMRSMLEDGVDKAMLGLTSIDELNKLNATVDLAQAQSEPMKISA